MINVRPLSSTIRVVDDNSLVTDIPAKLKNAIESMLPKENKSSHVTAKGYGVISLRTNCCDDDNEIVAHLAERFRDIF